MVLLQAPKIADGDHAMLSSKPLQGYKCMACDRPIPVLDERPGPYIPANRMPMPLQSGLVGALEGSKVWNTNHCLGLSLPQSMKLQHG